MDTMPRTDRLRGQASDIPHLVDALAHHYATQGWHIDALPAGGALEFSMRRGGEAWLVDCAYMDQDAVSRIPVEELLDEIVLRGATGGVLVTRGAFTDAALDAAAHRPHVRLVDGAVLASMVGARSGERACLARVRDGAGRLRQRVMGTADRHVRRGLARIGAHRAAQRPMDSLAVVTAGVFLLSLSLGLLVLVAYLLVNARESRASTPTVASASVAPLPAPQAPPQGYVAHAAGRAVFPVGGSGGSRALAAPAPSPAPTQAAGATLHLGTIHGVEAGEPVPDAREPGAAVPADVPPGLPTPPTEADAAIAVIAPDTPEVGQPH